MMKRKRAQSSSMFLLELILSILFFSIASAVCVQFFVRSHLLSTRADALNHAVNSCSSAAELVRGASDEDEFEQLIKDAFPNAVFAGDQITIGYDKDFSPCGENAVYCISIAQNHSSDWLKADITAYKTSAPDDLLYELSASHYVKGGH